MNTDDRIIMAARQSGKSRLNAMRQAKLQILSGVYFSKPRKDSLQRFIKRILKPRNHRYQSLLRGAHRSAAFIRLGHKEDCTPSKCNKECHVKSCLKMARPQ